MKTKLFMLCAIVCAMFLACCEEEPVKPVTLRKVETGEVSNITLTSATFHGVVNVDISQYEDVEFGMMVSEDKAELNARDGEMYKAKVLIGKDFELTLEGLFPETKYYYCAWVFLNNTQYEFGVIKEFVTIKENPNSNYTAKAFSVSDSKQVYFSPGNLQYRPAKNKWRFATSQLKYIGASNSNCSSTYNGWLDLFGWSTSATNFGVSTSTDDDYYSGYYVDWGRNKIGDDAPNTWRTLTRDEWDYLLNNRPNASYLKGVAQVNGVNGLILLPDNWICPSGVTFKSGFHKNYGGEYYAPYQTFTAEQWSKLEAAGAVFLPASGNRRGSDVRDVQRSGDYWSATASYIGHACYLNIVSNTVYMDLNFRINGLSVRLVKDL